MVETVRYSKAYLEDLAIGVGTAAVRLADGSTPSLTEIHLSGLLRLRRVTLRAADVPGLATMVWAGALPLGERIWGVTVRVVTTFGITNGLTGLLIGDQIVPDRWSNAPIALTQGTETTQGAFSDASLMVMSVQGDVVITALDGLFDTDGRLEVAVHTSLLQHPA